MDLVWLALAWVLWCSLHSLLIHPPVEQRLSPLFNRGRCSYRLAYNLFALLSLLPVALLYFQADAAMLLVWPAWLRPAQWLAWAVAFLLMRAAARAYDMSEFLGLRRTPLRQSPQEDDKQLRTGGVLRYSRHPWYLAGLLLLWCRDLAARDLLTNLLLTGYLLVGIRLEERKLFVQFGAAYQRYCQEVPMLFNPFRSRRRD